MPNSFGFFGRMEQLGFAAFLKAHPDIKAGKPQHSAVIAMIRSPQISPGSFSRRLVLASFDLGPDPREEFAEIAGAFFGQPAACLRVHHRGKPQQL